MTSTLQRPTGGHPGRHAHRSTAAGSTTPGPAAEEGTPSASPSLLDPALCLAADVLDDIERVRIANQNRIRQLTRVDVDADGEERGFGLDPEHPDVLRLAVMVHTLEQVEHDATLNLQRKLRKHPLGSWVKAQRGIGEKQAARLLAAIGDPYVNSATGRPRTVSALWAYSGLHVLPAGRDVNGTHQGPAGRDPTPASQSSCDTRDAPAGGLNANPGQTSIAAHSGDAGVGSRPGGDIGRGIGDDLLRPAGVAARRRKGERANWSTKAKTRAYLIAESCIKQLDPQCRDGHSGVDTQLSDAVPACVCSPYRIVYDTRRAHTAITHPDWTDGHSHADGLRITAKRILRELWRAAKDWHGQQ